MRQATLAHLVIAVCFGATGATNSCIMMNTRELPDRQPRITAAASPDPRIAVGELLFSDDFKSGLLNWVVELEKGGTVQAADGVMNIDVPAGCTVWLKRRLQGPLMIEYEAAAVSAGGPNDRVSDLNCFWMATDARSPEDLFATPRRGKFSEYDQLMGYYVGLGGNSNTTTRLRRYIGQQSSRPLLPEHDLRDARYLLVPNEKQKVRLVALGNLIQFYRDGVRVFELQDPHPYTQGHFGLRTVSSHLRVSDLRIYRLRPK